MYAGVQIPLHTAQGVLTVPIQAMQASGEDRGSVLVVNPDNKIEKRDLVLGIQSATDAEVVSGLKENDLVVFGEQSQYKPGETVAPKIVTPSAE
jgi:multidrug efflux pump subunit AcrA (membrane-fusion protein)